MSILLLLLTAIGLVISSYFSAIAYHWVQPNARWIPSFCRLGEQTCASIVFTPRARVLGPPNSVLGQIFYVALLGGVVFGWLDGPLLAGYLAASSVTVGMAVYLSYSLLFITKVPCVLCFTSHAINVAIWGLLVVKWTA